MFPSLGQGACRHVIISHLLQASPKIVFLRKVASAAASRREDSLR